MLEITIPTSQRYDEVNNEFIYVKGCTLKLEHSLVSISKWESKYHKPFISKEKMTYEETIYYIKCMTLTQNVDDSTYKGINGKILKEINEYIDDPMTAATFSKGGKGKSGGNNGEFITSESIYYWMISLQIPMKCEKWHLNRLMALIRFCNSKNTPSKKKSMREIMTENDALNTQRRLALGSKG